MGRRDYYLIPPSPLITIIFNRMGLKGSGLTFHMMSIVRPDTVTRFIFKTWMNKDNAITIMAVVN